MMGKPTGLRKRGERSWEIKFDLGRHPLTGKRQTRYHSFKGTKEEAKLRRAELITAAANGGYVDPSKLTVSEYLDRWERDWAEQNIGAKSLERYRELLTSYVRPEIGAVKLQQVTVAMLDELYSKLRREGRRTVRKDEGRGLSGLTVKYVHNVLHRAFGRAAALKLIKSNPCASVEAPKGKGKEIQILDEAQIHEVLTKLRGRPMYLIAAMGIATGMRRSELLALIWRNINLDGAVLRVDRAFEQTKAGGVQVKGPKTKSGNREISLPPSIVAELRSHRKRQAEQRLALGLGREPDDSLVFRRPDGSPILPNSLTTEWRRLVVSLKLPKVSLHAWRHTHASQLIDAGMDVVTISKRLGHGSPAITLSVYAHRFKSKDHAAADVFERAFGGTIRE